MILLTDWNEFKKKESSDAWILAKNPMKCFNCASCNNDIKVDSPIWYSPSAKFGEELERYLRGKFISYQFEESFFEIDDDGIGKIASLINKFGNAFQT